MEPSPPDDTIQEGSEMEAEKLLVFTILVGVGSIIANLLITALVIKLYTEYWKDITIKRRYEGKKD